MSPAQRPNPWRCRAALPGNHRAVVVAVASHFGFDYRDLTGTCRSDTMARARFVAMAMLRQRGLSYPEIARAIGRRDHTTAMHGCRRVAMDVELQGHMAAVEAGIQLVMGAQ